MDFTIVMVARRVAATLWLKPTLTLQPGKPLEEFWLVALKKHGGEELVTVSASLM